MSTEEMPGPIGATEAGALACRALALFLIVRALPEAIWLISPSDLAHRLLLSASVAVTLLAAGILWTRARPIGRRTAGNPDGTGTDLPRTAVAALAIYLIVAGIEGVLGTSSNFLATRSASLFAQPDPFAIAIWFDGAASAVQLATGAALLWLGCRRARLPFPLARRAS